MKKPNFKNIPYQRQNGIIKAETKWQTPEGIDIQTAYDKAVIEGYEHLDFVAGIAPNLRGPYSSMYAGRPWTIR